MTGEHKLLDILSGNDVTFFIPPYQRTYEWTNEQCGAFLEDIKKTYKSNKTSKQAEHFFGTVTYFSDETPFGEPDKLVLIDGQQRITTTMLFLTALRDVCTDQNIKKIINNKYLKNQNALNENGEYKIKLKQVESDWEVYKNIILEEQINEKQRESSIYRNYRWFKNELLKIQQEVELKDLIEYGVNNFSIVTIQLQPNKNSWENPQEIFESMNSLGKPLSLADLVRNYLLLGLDANTQTIYYNKYWLKIEETLPKQVSNFIRDYMQMCLGSICLKATEANHKKLYAQFKNMFQKENSEELLMKLKKFSVLYSYLVFDVSTENEKIDRVLSDIKQLNPTTAYSFFMCLLNEWKKRTLTAQDIIEVFTVFKIYCCRRRLVIGLTSAENKGFPSLVRNIDEIVKSSNKKEKMFEILASQESTLRIPNDIELKRVLETMNFYNFKYAKFYLALIEEHITKNMPDIENSVLQKEHIMPQTLSKDWKAALGPDYENIHQELINTIGNITLIRHNQELGNKPFEVKKELYKNNSGLQIAQTNIVDCEKWNAETIKRRSAWLTTYLLNEIFPIPVEMRRTNNFKAEGKRKELSFLNLQLIGETIDFIKDPSIKATVIGDKTVEFEGKQWKLSQLTREIETRKGTVNNSGSYQGAAYWEYDGIKLSEIM